MLPVLCATRYIPVKIEQHEEAFEDHQNSYLHQKALEMGGRYVVRNRQCCAQTSV